MPDSASPSDPDRRLAARIGAALDRGEPLASVLSEDEVGQALRTYRQRADRDTPDAAASERMWTAIAEATRDADSGSTPDEEQIGRAHV